MKYLIHLFLFFTTCLITNAVISQPGSIGGTLIMITPCQDEIIISADSRSAILGTNAYLAYFDSVPKIFRIKNFVLAVGGRPTINDKFIAEIIKDFEKKYTTKLDFTQTFINLRRYLYNTYPNSNDLKKMMIYGAGFTKDTPMVAFIDTAFTNILPYGALVNHPNATRFIQQNVVPKKCADVPKYLEKATYKYAEEANLKTQIGGPVCIVKIDKSNNVTFLKNDFRSRSYKSNIELYNAILDNKIKVHYMNEQAKDTVLTIYKMKTKRL